MDRAEQRCRKRNIACVTAGFFLTGLILFLLARKEIGIPCVFRLITDLRCPGCGNTHAVLMLVKGDVRSALACNYLFPLEFAYLLWVYFTAAKAYYKTGRGEYKSPLPVADVFILAVIILWGILRNILGI